ncbi:SnoaL-like domain-containing protein [Rhizobium sp. P40RR-XXII]|uniref:YybH family protein n=1 Tax=unclassified Rhizobium TaxID=2613769 RepID=UPI0014576363|nr:MULTISPECIES: nuclear transport factor 2 family protein [unclassified Rhizobium]NLR86841.1 SnoaL-like domain-containing protein [Rhizobium sp. P28RR-XV]NLS18138.1 SnoaL-like domain-containing protein [Rhizobium sp. P40RR-XXII]
MIEIIGNHDEAEAINAMLASWASALGNKDAAGVVRHLSDDTVSFTLAAPLVHKGKGEKGLEAWFSTWEGPIGGDAVDVRLTVGGDAAFWTGLVHMTGRKTDGVEGDLWFRQTLGLRKEAGIWKIVHEHTSVPFAMDGSGLAELELKP